MLIDVFFSGCLTTEYNLATQKQETYIYSTEKEVSIGRSIAKKIEKKFKLADKNMQYRIAKIGRRLAEVSDRQDIVYHFKVIEDKQANAVALPGGFIYISDSLVNMADSDDEVAAVLAHEISHVAARHSVKKMQGSYLINFLRILTARLPSDDPFLRKKIDYAFGSLIIQYVKEDEIEADKLSVKYMKKAGFDVSALLTMLEKIKEVDKKKGRRRFTYFRTHPPVATRQGVIRQAITGQIDFEGYINRPETILY
jgi:predicted Zn-dependent protease